jgi:hypothetical protein
MLDKRSIAVLIIISALLISVAHAQDARLQGVFVNATQSEQPIKKAVDEGAAQINFLLRPIARSRLKKTNPNITRVAIARAGDDITIALGTSKPSTARPGGPTIKWSTFIAPDGKRVNRYTLSSDGNTLSLEIALTSDMLKKPVEYTLAFVRESKL